MTPPGPPPDRPGPGPHPHPVFDRGTDHPVFDMLGGLGARRRRQLDRMGQWEPWTAAAAYRAGYGPNPGRVFDVFRAALAWRPRPPVDPDDVDPDGEEP